MCSCAVFHIADQKLNTILFGIDVMDTVGVCHLNLVIVYNILG